MAAAIVGCGYVNISWNVTGNNDECSVSSYNVTLTMDGNVTEFMITIMNSSTITGLPDDTQFNITIYGINKNRKILSFDSTSVRTMKFESTYVCV